MAQGRGSACSVPTVVGLALICLVILSESAQAVTYTVGDTRGWTFNTNSWPNGKRFRAGDVLIFKYPSSVHNVAVVNAAGYSSCSAPRGSQIRNSGNDRVTLARGTNYFICSLPGHCQSGMKIAVTAA